MSKLKIFKKNNSLKSVFMFMLLVIFSLGCSSSSNTYKSAGLFSNGFIIDKDTSNFSDDDFDIEIKKLNKELKHLNGIKIRVRLDNDKIKKELRKMKFNSKINCDEIDELVHNLKVELEDNPINVNIDFDFKELNKSMEKLKENLKDMKIDMSNLKVEMKKLKSFLHELRSELIKDGYVENDDEDFDLEFTKDKIVVNGEILPDNLLEKYKNIYKKHYGREIDGKFRMKK